MSKSFRRNPVGSSAGSSRHPRPLPWSARLLVGLRLYIALSVVVHALVIALSSLYSTLKPEAAPKRLEVYLKPLDLPVPLPEPLPASLPALLSPPPEIKTVVVAAPPAARLESEQGPATLKQPEKPVAKQPAPQGFTPQVRRQLAEQVQAFYPDDYVQQKIEGEVLLRLFVDSSTGKMMAVRVETPSSHDLFNEAARQAVLASVSSVGPNMPTELLLPVKFRLGR